MSSTAIDPRIRVLPPQVANQIAAGEVVERPASVVKELLENSLDAGATTLELDIERGGVQRIFLRDDGHGIHRDDLLLALSPHATSKIAHAEDLEGVGSLGFRGEALASIASVSRLQLKSRRNSELSGWSLNGGEAVVTPASLLPGTEIEVCDLFYNTPARRKFLRSERTEFLHVEEVVRRIALSRFDLAVRFSHNGKPLLRLKLANSGAERQRRVTEVLGKAFLDNSIELDVSTDGVRLWGWLGRSDYSRSHADSQFFYLNGRMIRDRLVNHAVRLAFAERIPEGRFPAYLLYLELDPKAVDVNVHPTKHEVRFREARQVHDFLYWAVNRTLQNSLVVEPEVPRDSEPLTVLRAAQQHYKDTRSAQERYKTPLHSVVAELQAGYRFGIHRTVSQDADTQSLGRVVAQLRSGYLLSERHEETLLIDLRALLVALNLQRFASPQKEELLTPQPLLIPFSTLLSRDAAQLWQRHGARLQSWGFEWGWLGEATLVVRHVPALLRSASIQRVVAALGGWLSTLSDDEQGAEEALQQLLASQALPESMPSFGANELNSLLREYEQQKANRKPVPWRLLGAAEWQQLFEQLPEPVE